MRLQAQMWGRVSWMQASTTEYWSFNSQLQSPANATCILTKNHLRLLQWMERKHHKGGLCHQNKQLVLLLQAKHIYRTHSVPTCSATKRWHTHRTEHLCSIVQQAVIGTSAAGGCHKIPQITIQTKKRYTEHPIAPSWLLTVVSLVSPLFLSAAC